MVAGDHHVVHIGVRRTVLDQYASVVAVDKSAVDDGGSIAVKYVYAVCWTVADFDVADCDTIRLNADALLRPVVQGGGGASNIPPSTVTPAAVTCRMLAASACIFLIVALASESSASSHV